MIDPFMKLVLIHPGTGSIISCYNLLFPLIADKSLPMTFARTAISEKNGNEKSCILERLLTFHMIFPRPLSSPLSSFLVLPCAYSLINIPPCWNIPPHIHTFVPLSFLLPLFLLELCSQLTFESLLLITFSSNPFLSISPNIWNPFIRAQLSTVPLLGVIQTTRLYHVLTCPSLSFSVSDALLI